MFDRLFQRAERKIDSVVSKYVRRIVVAVPLVVAAVFATAAISVKVVEVYGSVNGYAIMAGGFTVIAGLVALFTMTGSSTPVEKAEAAAAKAAETAKEESDADSPLLSPELLSVITAAAPMALPGVARAAARNLPMLVVLAIIGYLFARYASRPSSPGEATSGAADDAANKAAADAAANARASEAVASMATRAAAA